jgi:hypothetical protein
MLFLKDKDAGRMRRFVKADNAARPAHDIIRHGSQPLVAR